MGILNLTRFPQGGRLTSDWLNRIFGALTGDLYLRDEDGNLSDGTENIGSDGNRVGTIFANNLDLGDGVSLVTRTGQAWWNGILKGGGVATATTGANYDLSFPAGTIVAAAGKQKTMAGTVTIPAPVGSAPRSALFDIRKFPLCARAMSTAATFTDGRAPVLERTVSGSVKEYARGVFYDVGATADTVTAAAFIGAHAEPGVAPTAEVGDGDRMLSAADNRIYRRASGAWLATDEALIGAVLFDDSNGQLRGVDFRSREFLEIVRNIPLADYVRFADSRASNAQRVGERGAFQLFRRAVGLDFPDFVPWFRDPATGALTPLTAAVSQDAFLGMAASPAEAKPLVLTNAGEAAKGIFARASGVIQPSRAAPDLARGDFPSGNLEDGGENQRLYVGDGIAGWGRDADERTLLSNCWNIPTLFRGCIRSSPPVPLLMLFGSVSSVCGGDIVTLELVLRVLSRLALFPRD